MSSMSTSGLRSRLARILAVLAVVLAVPSAAHAAPGVPQPPTTVYSEDFQNGSGPTELESYASTSGASYTADSYWLNQRRCNGFILSNGDAYPGATYCNSSSTFWGVVRTQAYVLGLLNTPQNPTTNRAVSSYSTGAADNASNTAADGAIPTLIEFGTAGQVTLPSASGRFVTFSVDAVGTNCGTPPLLRFYVRNAAGVETAVSSSAIDPCNDPRKQTIVISGRSYSYGSFPANSSVLLTGSSLGVVMRNERNTTSGNDGAFDNIRILDVTPTLDKSFSPSTLEVGQSSTLTFTITNTSDLAAKNGWSFTDALPAGLVMSTPTAASSTCSAASVTAAPGGTSVAATGNLNSGQASCTVSVNVTSPRIGTYTNGPGNVSRVGLNPPGSSSVSFQDADVSIVKSVSDKTPALGDTITYTLAVHNNGPADARNVVVNDTAAAGIVLLSATPSQGSCSSPAACQLGLLSAGGSATITVTAKAAAEGSAANTATVSTGTPDRDSSNNTSSETIDVHPSADLRIVKTASVISVHEGQDFRYTLVVTNDGPSTARAATVTDSLPAGVALRSVSTSRGSCGQSDPVVCAVGDIPVGGTATITLNVTATDAGRPENTAIVESPTLDPNLANNSDHTQVTTDRLADVAIAKSASTSVVADGEAFDWTLKVVNHGPSRALGAVVTDTVPSGLRIEAVSSSRGTCTASGQTITCELGDVGSGGTAAITITVLTTKAGSYTNGASVTSQTPDPNPGNNVDNAAVEVSARADVAIAKTASAPIALVGDTVIYGITVTNHGPDDAADVTVTDPLPAGGVFVSAKPSTGSCAMVAGSLVCDLGSMAPGAAVTIQLQVTLSQAGDTRNVAQVTSSTPDPKPSNNQATTSTTTEKADVVLTKTASAARPSIGQTVTYTITARNAGPALARGVTVTDPIPASLKYVSAKPTAGACTHAQDAVVCNLGDIPNGKSVKVTLKAVVRRVGDAGNAASVVSRWPDDPNLANNLARSVVKAPAPHLTLRKTASRSTLSTAGHVTFNLRVRNTGGSTAHQVLVCDDLPSGLVATDTTPRARLRGDGYCWTLASLAPGRARTFTITAMALSSASGRRVNHATLNARDARALTASRAVRVDRIRVLGGGVTG
jgi:uncharacterized repeat protein (TIGR01451 family)